jgi:hypothetical protein
MDVRAIKARIEALRRQTRSSILGRLLGTGDSLKKEELTTLEQLMRIARRRRSRSRCLSCRSEQTHALSFDEHGLSAGFTHECGGRLRREPADQNAPRVHFRLERLRLDVEGLPLPEDGNAAQESGRDDNSDVVDALVDQGVGCQSLLYRVFVQQLGADEEKIRRIEVTYLAASVITYSYLRFGQHQDRERLLDNFARTLLEKSIPSSRDPTSLGKAAEELRHRYAEYSALLQPFFSRSESPNPIVTFMLHAFQCVTGSSARDNMIRIVAASGIIQQLVIDQIKFAKGL